MSARPVLPLWVEDFRKRTADLSAAEMGVYILLLTHMWLQPDGSLPNEPKRLARLVKCDSRNFVRWYMPRVVQRFFRLGTDNRWRQDWITKEIRKFEEFAARQRQTAKIGWEKRKNAAQLAFELSTEPVDNPVESCGKKSVSSVRDPQKTFPNEINGRHHAAGNAAAMPPLRKKEVESLSDRSQPDPAGGGNKSQKNQKSEIQSRQAAPARKMNFRQARAAWEGELAGKLGPDAYAQAVERLAADPALCERATAAEQRIPGSGLQAIVVGLQRQQHARDRRAAP